MKLHTVAWLVTLAAGTTQAVETLPDPTRPPALLQAAAPASSAPNGSGALVLQSVLLGGSRTPAAIINGQLIRLGGQVGDLRLARVTEHAVELQGQQGATLLTLLPDAQKLTHTKPQGAESK